MHAQNRQAEIDTRRKKLLGGEACALTRPPLALRSENSITDPEGPVEL
jgi:hypothetical protein